MKTLLRLGYAAALATLATGTSFAAGSEGSQLTAFVGSGCTIVATSGTIDLTGAVGVPVQGLFTYKCNFVGPNVLLNFKSNNGGVQNGSDKADYGIFLNDQTPAAVNPNPNNWLHAANAQGAGVTFPNISVPVTAGANRSPYFYLALLQPTVVAGTYSDILTITINP